MQNEAEAASVEELLGHRVLGAVLQHDVLQLAGVRHVGVSALQHVLLGFAVALHSRHACHLVPDLLVNAALCLLGKQDKV